MIQTLPLDIKKGQLTLFWLKIINFIIFYCDSFALSYILPKDIFALALAILGGFLNGCGSNQISHEL